MQSRQTTIPESASTHLKHQKTSGLSIAAYCRKNNINATTFYGWNKRYKKGSMAKKPSEQTKTSFIEIPVKSSLQSGSDASHPVHISHTEITIPVAAAKKSRNSKRSSRRWMSCLHSLKPPWTAVAKKNPSRR